MKDKKPISQKAAILKRGTEVWLIEEQVYAVIQRYKGDGVYFVRIASIIESADDYIDADVSNIKEKGKSLKSLNSSPKSNSSPKANSKADLDLFFAQQALKIPRTCMNCNKRLLAFNNFGRRCVTAHILPKAEFPTLATEELNIFYLGAVVLGGCSCHDDWDRKGAEHRTTMPIYALALERFEEELKYKLDGKDYVRACSYLKIQWQ